MIRIQVIQYISLSEADDPSRAHVFSGIIFCSANYRYKPITTHIKKNIL